MTDVGCHIEDRVLAFVQIIECLKGGEESIAEVLLKHFRSDADVIVDDDNETPAWVRLVCFWILRFLEQASDFVGENERYWLASLKELHVAFFGFVEERIRHDAFGISFASDGHTLNWFIADAFDNNELNMKLSTGLGFFVGAVRAVAGCTLLACERRRFGGWCTTHV